MSFAELVAGKDVALVGSAASIGEFGADIDKHEVVVRINGRQPDRPERCGRRTDAFFCGYMLRNSFEWEKHGTLHGVPAFHKAEDVRKASVEHLDPLDPKSPAPKHVGCTSGLLAAFEAVRAKARSVTLYGYDGWRSPDRYAGGYGDITPVYAATEQARLALLQTRYSVKVK